MITKKRNFIALSMLSAIGLLGFICVISLTINTINPSKADGAENAIIFNNWKNIITKDPIVKSEKGTNFTMFYNDIESGTTSGTWQNIKAGGCFYTTDDGSYDKNAIHDMKTLSITFNKRDLDYTIYFSRDGSFENGKCWSKGYKTKTEEQTINFEGHPRYFKLVAVSSFGIYQMKITYGCDASADTTWDNNHGINPIIDTTTNTLTYGLFPQTHIKEPEQGLINAGNGKNDEEYFWYKNEYYVKDTGTPYGEKYTFSTGSLIKGTETYYFKCEPIKWNIVALGDTYYTLDCSNILYAHTFSYSSSTYYDSYLKAWATGEFYYNAFKLNSSVIQETDLEDVKVTKQKAWVGSYEQYYEEWYEEDGAARKQVSDFALCNYAYMSEDRNGYYWTRSPEIASQSNVMCVNDLGGFVSAIVKHPEYGNSPSLTIKK